MNRNLTVSVDERSYRAARVAAAQRGVSVSELVRQYFRGLEGGGRTHEERVAELMGQLDKLQGHSARNRERDRERLHER